MYLYPCRGEHYQYLVFISIFPENIIHYPEYCILFPSYKRDVFITYMCTKYVVQFFLLLSFIKITCICIYTHTHKYIHDSGNCIFSQHYVSSLATGTEIYSSFLYNMLFCGELLGYF